MENQEFGTHGENEPNATAITLPRTGVVLAATPLGNLGDASPRLVYALEHADFVAAEDTRRTRQLANALGVTIRGRIISNFDHNEESRVDVLLEHARTGCVLVVTDAGMPSVSDPGFPLVDRAHDEGVPVTCLPGPSAVPTALALSGLRVGTFCFDGFAPRKDGARREWLEEVATQKRATCFFESPHRLAATLALAAEIVGPTRRAAVTRELTKLHEEVRRGTLQELAEWATDGVRGEITVVIEGATAEERAVDTEDLVPFVLEAVEAGERMKAAVKRIAAENGQSSKQLYDACVEARKL
ncbi:MAG: 16S rRNA (cytidine(1402)-2'-O)-methyltransferase [Corynebacterium glucuronolyticum]|nr:16S rRNA (cytidine(1402)-2'-O)-methyltransferase [Corynebacterium glucuronolyticum]MDD7587083.1 16S rRNA (cytidine(1402)-2'-O)-methyltransferase [Mycobacteriaceae bacterium]MDY5834770.1 16S rRNA (cytidine(1402)-2'-O)-methyltransferase [Corynebacterium glucuronolyticum]